MKRFLITSQKFTGQAELLYNDAGVLCKIDVTDTNMSAQTVHQFKASVPAHTDMLGVAFSNLTTIVEAEYEVSFDMFWKKYNKKVNKSRCMLLWGKLNKSMQVQAFFGIEAYNKFLKKEGDWRKPVDPENYLRNKYWENEYE
ncbi:MAG TPA: hypothetical protein VIJ57_06935 [Hanamia sp.]